MSERVRRNPAFPTNLIFFSLSMVRSHVIFSGRVQGVGFRYTAQRLANEHKLLGWVKNLPDGRVEMLAEGPRERIEHLLFKLDSRFQITKKDLDWLEPKGQFTGFDIAY